jgi:hypothetical protein
MNGALILLVVLVSPYVVANESRRPGGQPWGRGSSSRAKECEQREYAKRVAARAAPPAARRP